VRETVTKVPGTRDTVERVACTNAAGRDTFITASTGRQDVQVGTDEAGKGPVLGSMFAAAVRADPSELPADVADSKRLTAPRREGLAATIRDRAAATSVVEIPVERIDDPETDMNGLTVAAHTEALAAVVDGTEQRWDAVTGLTVYLDAADTNAVRFERRVRDGLDDPPAMQAEHGADETYPVVSAASILAKVERDAHVAELAAEYGDVGSGYPGDPTTRAFLRRFVDEHGELPGCARRSWQTSADMLAERGQSALSEFGDEDRDQRSLSEF
jgi:ribonuclease HII